MRAAELAFWRRRALAHWTSGSRRRMSDTSGSPFNPEPRTMPSRRLRWFGVWERVGLSWTSIRSRALYAIGTAFVAKGDHGNWQFDYSDVLGGMASHELSTLYYPSTSRPVRRLVDDVLLGFAGRAEDNLLHEFILRHITTHVPKIAAGLTHRILPEGTPVSLISVEDWTSKKAENGGPVAFMLAQDIQVDGVIVAPIGSKAWAHASFTGGDDKTMRVGLDNVRLKTGDTDVPLRSTPLKDGGAALEYHRLENSGRIALVLYVAGNVRLPQAR